MSSTSPPRAPTPPATGSNPLKRKGSDDSTDLDPSAASSASPGAVRDRHADNPSSAKRAKLATSPQRHLASSPRRTLTSAGSQRADPPPPPRPILDGGLTTSPSRADGAAGGIGSTPTSPTTTLRPAVTSTMTTTRSDGDSAPSSSTLSTGTPPDSSSRIDAAPAAPPAPPAPAKIPYQPPPGVRAIPVEQLIKPCSKGMSPAVQEERDGIIEFKVVVNDGTPESTMLLTGLKNIFQRQLPKMPREYIGKLVYDRSHVSLCLLRKADPPAVLGGICYKPFFNRKFAEIVFCAITGTEQVKGYGSHLMNHLKDHVMATGDLRFFLTYADNYAIGYFRKQGFTTDITLDKAIWMGYIKDYEGGTIMQCTMVPKVKYLSVYQTLKQQKEVLYRRIFEVSRSNLVYPGLKVFKEKGVKEIDPMTIPGMPESGWTPELSRERSKKAKSPLYVLFMQLLDDMRSHPNAWPFLEPVDGNQVKDYYDVIKEPMDLRTLETHIESDHYKSIGEFTHDVKKIFNNCRQYNDPSTTYFKSANRLETFFHDRLKVLLERDNTGL
ncbi:histone acetyltransferase [Allomyces javanicus]|nr:histone acetyltransferase [Allomyces javanicus]